MLRCAAHYKAARQKARLAKTSKVGDLWFETSTWGLSEEISAELAGEKFEGKLMGADGGGHCSGFSH